MTVNFDNAATTYPKPPEVRRAVADAIARYGNAGRGGHVIAERTSEMVYHARETVADFLYNENPQFNWGFKKLKAMGRKK